MTRIIFFILLQLFFAFPILVSSSVSCPSSSCGNITNISYPFKLKTDPESEFCGRKKPFFHLDCQNNHTVLTTSSKKYFVQEFDYYAQYFYGDSLFSDGVTIRVANPGINRGNLSSCPLYSFSHHDWKNVLGYRFYLFFWNAEVSFIHCLSPMNSTKYVEASFCGNNKSYIFGNSSEFYSYIMYNDGEYRPISDLEESCTVDKVALVSPRSTLINSSTNPRSSINSSSLADIYDVLADGFLIGWISDYKRWWYPNFVNIISVMRGGFRMDWFRCDSFSSRFHCFISDIARYYTKRSRFQAYFLVGASLLSWPLAFKLIGFMIGFPFLMWLVVHKWRGRHLSMDKTVEEFLKNRHNLAPIKYTYSEIKKMTNNFSEKLGEGGYGTVYKGKLRSGPYVAIKMMEESMAMEDEFISEVGTIGQIHHVNIVQLIGYCIQHSKYALVYEFLPNGSLDRYNFNQNSIGILALTFDKIFEIALGVARGINYLHHGCNMQILHFDIKPHNILLNEIFSPKISDFGLAKLHPTDASFINLSAIRGTVGYMAPEIFYKNIGHVSYKVDVYSFGMMLMEMVSRRINMNHSVKEMSRIYFPSWVYNQLCTGKDIGVNNVIEEEKLIVKKIIIVALWCIQMKPSDRPPMNKVVEMLEDDSEPRMPPKPFVTSCEIPMSDDDGIAHTYRVDYLNLDLVKS